MRKYFKGLAFYIIIFIVFLYMVTVLIEPSDDVKALKADELIAALQADQIANIEIQDSTNPGTQVAGTLKDGTAFSAYIPDILEDQTGQALMAKIIDKAIETEGLEAPTRPWFLEFLPTLIIILMFVVVWFVFMQNSQGGGNKVMSFGKSRAKLHKADEGKIITFSDVAGLKEEKEEMFEIVDFLKYPKKYIDLGARIPKGILMVGPPGTGKTYLSRAVAGEAGVPFYSISGSDFVEMFVGVGASRVRDLFETAKKNAPCIIFIDEIDAVGRKRGAGLGGGHDEREQTLNQLLVEMDGFGDHEGIILIAATNRPDILDPALLRPGRFDRQVTVGVPDVREREQILAVHAKNKPMEDKVDLSVVAKGTPGFTPADLENVLNEAALLAARNNDLKISMPYIEEARTKIIAGVEKKSRIVSEKERRLTAYHEGGHAICAKVLPGHDPVHQVTIIPRGRAGGFTMHLPQEERSYKTKTQMQNDLVSLLGGRTAEKLVLHDVSTGASSDLKRVTKIAKAMVTKYAMSENLGQMSYVDEEEVFIGRDMTSKRNHSEQVAAEIDREVRRIIDTAYDEASRILEEHMDQLHQVAKALLEFETITGEEFELVFNEGFEALKAKTTKEPMEVNDVEDVIDNA